MIIGANIVELRNRPMMMTVRLSFMPKIADGPTRKRKKPIKNELSIKVNLFWM